MSGQMQNYDENTVIFDNGFVVLSQSIGTDDERLQIASGFQSKEEAKHVARDMMDKGATAVAVIPCEFFFIRNM